RRRVGTGIDPEKWRRVSCHSGRGASFLDAARTHPVRPRLQSSSVSARRAVRAAAERHADAGPARLSEADHPPVGDPVLGGAGVLMTRLLLRLVFVVLVGAVAAVAGTVT